MKYSRVQKFKTNYQKYPFFVSSIVISSGLFKIVTIGIEPTAFVDYCTVVR